MSFSADIYKEIQADIAKNDNVSGRQAMRKITENNGIDIVFAIHVNSGMRAVYFCVGKGSAKKSFPKWKGIDIQIVKLPAYGTLEEATFFALPGALKKEFGELFFLRQSLKVWALLILALLMGTICLD